MSNESARAYRHAAALIRAHSDRCSSFSAECHEVSAELSAAAVTELERLEAARRHGEGLAYSRMAIDLLGIARRINHWADEE